MTQRIFDTDNEKDMQDLWDIVPDNTEKIKKSKDSKYFDRLYKDNGDILVVCFLNINWHDKTEITRPIQEATGADIGKLCKFWDKEEQNNYGVLEEMTNLNDELRFWKNNTGYEHCRRLTKQEIEELC